MGQEILSDEVTLSIELNLVDIGTMMTFQKFS